MNPRPGPGGDAATAGRLRIAVIGGGVSGLVCAHVLSPAHDVTLFESSERLGGHAHTVEVEIAGERQSIDTGFIVFNRTNYPRFSRLLDQLGVASQETEMSFSVRCDRSGLEYNGTSLNKLFAQRRNLLRPAFWGMLRDILRFAREAPRTLELEDDRMSVEEFAAAGAYGSEFLERYLVPLGSALWSSPPAGFRAFPIRFVVEFLRQHSMLDAGGRPTWRVVQGGSSRYVEALSRRLRARVRVGVPVRSLRRARDHVAVDLGPGGVETFDEAIVACHADDAAALLADPSPVEKEVLGAFPYQENEAVLHTDPAALPRRKLAWASWNFHLRADGGQRAAVTYNMNLLQRLRSRSLFCVTLNDEQDIDPRRILRRMRYRHPVFGRDRARAQARHGELIRARRTSYCGAYWGYGFHEDGVRSALAVCSAFGRTLEA